MDYKRRETMSEEKSVYNVIASSEMADKLMLMPDEVLSKFAFPLMGSHTRHKYDADGFPIVTDGDLQDLQTLQKECWNKADSNPQINSHVRDIAGRMAGWGFEFTGQTYDLQETIDELVEDPRNDLYVNFPKYCARKEIEGELFLCFTLHSDGFVEIDFIPPASIGNGGDNNSGIIFHPTKQTFPLFYVVNFENMNKKGIVANTQSLIPSINICYYPDLEASVKDHSSYDEKKLQFAKAKYPNKAPFKQLNGYQRFILHWNAGFMTKRNASHIKTTIEWVNHYEKLKMYEIDHKKSSGAYLWVIKMEDIKAFRNWLQLSEEDRKKTGIMQPKDAGGTLVLPPGMTLECINPKLASISDQDTDIMQMVSSGLQKPQDVMLGDYRSTYASVKASQGPQGDRINDELHYFKIFLTYHFWKPICYLRSLARSDFKYERNVMEVIDFKNQKPVKRKIKKPVYKMIDIALPVSRLEDMESIAKALLGSKHASVVDTLGIPRNEVARRIGFPNYSALRRAKALEDEFLPETLSVIDQEKAQEKTEGERGPDPSDKQDDGK